MHHILVVCSRRIFFFGTALPLKKGRIGCSVSSAISYQSTLCRLPEEHRSRAVDTYKSFVRTYSPHLWESQREKSSFTRKIEAAVFSKLERLYYVVLYHR